MSEERYNPGFLTDEEQSREKRRTAEMVKGFVKTRAPYYCNVCKQTISEAVYEYSKSHFGIPLCLDHQESARNDELLRSKATPSARSLQES